MFTELTKCFLTIKDLRNKAIARSIPEKYLKIVWKGIERSSENVNWFSKTKRRHFLISSRAWSFKGKNQHFYVILLQEKPFKYLNPFKYWLVQISGMKYVNMLFVNNDLIECFSASTVVDCKIFFRWEIIWAFSVRFVAVYINDDIVLITIL